MVTLTCVMLLGPQAWRVSSSFVAGSSASIVTCHPHCVSAHWGQLQGADPVPFGQVDVRVTGMLSGFNSNVNSGRPSTVALRLPAMCTGTSNFCGLRVYLHSSFTPGDCSELAFPSPLTMPSPTT